ncbi:MAG: outer membrane protein assembly factor BamD [Gemmatimonadales bacterium]|nr:outer membrane protein assembly factor BamD [Gemmatimonadales bacterium]
MMRRTMVLIGLIVVAAGGGGCRPGGRTPVRSSPQPEAELARAMTQFRRGNFRGAQQQLQRLTFEFGRNQAELAQVRFYLAECYFQTGDRVTAANDFRKVADEFPTSEYAPLALLRAGDANLRLWRRAELDPTYGEIALATYQELAIRFPETDAAARARPHVVRLQNQFADKAYKNGLFYFKRRAWDSAIIYFKEVVANFPGSRRAPDALLRLVDTYRVIGYTPELQETCEHLRRFYPQAVDLNQTCPVSADTAGTRS